MESHDFMRSHQESIGNSENNEKAFLTDPKVAELRDVFQEKFRGKNMLAQQDKIAEFMREMTEEFGRDELNKKVLFHVIIGSNRYENIVDGLDLPGGEIEAFIRHEL